MDSLLGLIVILAMEKTKLSLQLLHTNSRLIGSRQYFTEITLFMFTKGTISQS